MPRLLPPKEEGDFIFMGEALIVRRGGNSGGEVTIDGEKVNTKMLLQSVKLSRAYLQDCPYASIWTAAVVFNGEVHLLGGTGGAQKHCAWNGTSWSEVSTIPAYFTHAAAAVVDGKIFIVGGQNVSSTFIACYMWDGTAWTQRAMFVPHPEANGINNMSAVAVGDTFYAAVMNYGIKRLDGESWTTIRSENFTYYKLCTINDELYVVYQKTSSSDAYLAKWSGTSWQNMGSITRTSQGLGGAVAIGYDNEIHLFGGSGSNYVYSKSHSWWDGSKWQDADNLPFNFSGGSVLKLEDGIHLLQGVRDNSGTSSGCNDHSWLKDKFYVEASE